LTPILPLRKETDEAQHVYRQAIDKAGYGYCLGTALNFLGRYDEALPILLEQASIHQPDAMSWFQVAVAQEGVGDIAGCQASYLSHGAQIPVSRQRLLTEVLRPASIVILALNKSSALRLCSLQCDLGEVRRTQSRLTGATAGCARRR
jgi:hypothetical protein